MSFQKHQQALQQGKILKPSDYDFVQAEIVKFAQSICFNHVHSARVQQWCNGDHIKGTYNYLRQCNTNHRRLTQIGEFSFEKEVPDFNLFSRCMQDAITKENGLHPVNIQEIVTWVRKEYTQIKF